MFELRTVINFRKHTFKIFSGSFAPFEEEKPERKKLTRQIFVVPQEVIS